MKTANPLIGKTDDINGGSSRQSLAESYQVPALDGRMVQAIPLKFCLNFTPPTIAVVYTFQHSSSKKNKSGKVRKYVREIKVDFKSCLDPASRTLLSEKKPTLKQVEKLCEQLCEREPSYLNINIISKKQVSKRLPWWRCLSVLTFAV